MSFGHISSLLCNKLNSITVPYTKFGRPQLFSARYIPIKCFIKEISCQNIGHSALYLVFNRCIHIPNLVK